MMHMGRAVNSRSVISVLFTTSSDVDSFGELDCAELRRVSSSAGARHPCEWRKQSCASAGF